MKNMNNHTKPTTYEIELINNFITIFNKKLSDNIKKECGQCSVKNCKIYAMLTETDSDENYLND